VLAQTEQPAPAQPGPTPDLANEYVLETMYDASSPLVYQKLTDWRWMAFSAIRGWKPKPGEIPVQAVKIFAMQQPGPTIVRVKLLRGEHLDIEERVGDYAVTEKKTVVEELAKFGIVPFEIRLVRAPATVADLPTIKNLTKSLVVSVEPAVGVLPTFNGRFLNSSDKPVLAFSYLTSIGTTRHISGTAADRTAGILIAPGVTYQQKFPYPTKRTGESNGVVPEALRGLQLNILCVVFADGSYEGDQACALKFRGRKLGEEIQLTRILNLLRSPAASNAAQFERKANELQFKVELAEVKVLATEFPGMTDEAWEWARVAAEVAANNIGNSFKSNFGTASTVPPDTFAEAIKAAIARCESLLEVLP